MLQANKPIKPEWSTRASARLSGGADVLRGTALAWLTERGLPRFGLRRTCAWLGLGDPTSGLQPAPFPITIPERVLLRSAHCAGIALRVARLPSTCLRLALVVGHLTRAYRPTLRLGVSRRAPFEAHAWLEYPDGTTWNLQPDAASSAAPGLLRALT